MENCGGQSCVASGYVYICGFGALGSCGWSLPFTCHSPKKVQVCVRLRNSNKTNTKSRRPVLCPLFLSWLTVFSLMLAKASEGSG